MNSNQISQSITLRNIQALCVEENKLQANIFILETYNMLLI